MFLVGTDLHFKIPVKSDTLLDCARRRSWTRGDLHSKANTRSFKANALLLHLPFLLEFCLLFLFCTLLLSDVLIPSIPKDSLLDAKGTGEQWEDTARTAHECHAPQEGQITQTPKKNCAAFYFPSNFLFRTKPRRKNPQNPKKKKSSAPFAKSFVMTRAKRSSVGGKAGESLLGWIGTL